MTAPATSPSGQSPPDPSSVAVRPPLPTNHLRRTVVRVAGGTFVVRPWATGVGIFLTALALVLFAISIATSDFPMTAIDAGRILLGGGTRAENVVVFDTQLPIGLVSLLVGFGLGMSGALTQVIARNPLATPDMLGITSGASAAAVAVIAFGSTWASWLADLGLAMAALLGGLATAALMYVLTWRKGIDPIRLVLVGVAITWGLQALIAYLLTRADIDQVQRAQLWIVGSVSGAGWSAVWPPLIVLVPAIAIVCMQNRNLSLISLGDDVCRGLGVRANPVSAVVLIVAVIVAAVCVSSAGPIAFVALLAPQIAMRLTRAEVPGPITSGLTGACLVIGSDLLCRTVMPDGIPVGVVTAGIGGPALIYLMIQINRKASV